MRLSLVIPCYNEEAVIEHLAEALRPVIDEIGDTEVILIDDGSSDGTVAKLREVCADNPEFRYLKLSRNFGKEAAMLAGLRDARGDAVALLDADLQHPPELVPRMLKLLDTGVDQVVAHRDRAGDPVLRSFISRAYYRFVNSMIDVRLKNGVGDFRVLSRKAVDALLSMPEVHRFSKGLFVWIGFETASITYPNAERVGGESKWGFKSLFNYALESVISFNTRPLRLAIYIGLLVSLIAMGYGVWVVVEAVLHGNAVPGYVTLICAVVGLGGLQMIMLGVLGEYIGRIYGETKRRPSYFVSERSDR